MVSVTDDRWYFVNILLLVGRGDKVTSHIIIGTPGTLMDWILKVRAFDPKKIRVFVLDEADVMIDTQGHKDQSVRIHK
jgi:ATP-dependent RNA helicase DDX19/DBP5